MADEKDEAPVVEATEEGRSFAVEGNDTDDYVGVSPEYRTYANDTEAPHRGEGVEEVIQTLQQDSDEENATVLGADSAVVDGGVVAPSTAQVEGGEADEPDPDADNVVAIPSVDPASGQPEAGLPADGDDDEDGAAAPN